MVENKANCKTRVLEYLKRVGAPCTARMISVSTGMQANTAIKYLKFLIDEGYDIKKGWLKVSTPGRSVRVRTYMIERKEFPWQE